MSEDSGAKNQTQADSPENPSGVTAMVMQRKGQPVTILRNEGGKFVAKKSVPLPPTKEFIRKRRKRALKPSICPRYSDVSESEAAFEELIEMVHMEIETDAKTGLPDARMAKVKLDAIELFHTLVEGKTPTSEIDTEGHVVNPINTVLVVSPPDVKPMEERKIATTPTFAEVLGITTNKK